MLYPIELSIGGRTGFEPATDGLRRCSTSELSSACGTPSPDPRHTPRQCRAHRTGNKPVPLWIVHRCSALAPRRKRQSVCDCIRLPPVPKHPGTAHPCAFAGFPASDQHCPDASGARCNRVLIVWISFARTPKQNAPGCWNPRAFAWPREIGVTDLRDAKGSVDVGGALVIPLAAFGQKRIAPFARAQARIALGRWQQCSDVEGMRHGISCSKESPVAKVAHLTRAFFVWQQNFYITDERHASSGSWRMSAQSLAMRKTTGKKKPASLRASSYRVRRNRRLT